MIHEFQALALRTAKPMTTRREVVRHAALGMTTEIGEFATEVKRHLIYGKPLGPEMVDHMIEESGDFPWYVAILAEEHEMKMGDFRHNDFDMGPIGKGLDDAVALGTMAAGVCWTLAYQAKDTSDVEIILKMCWKFLDIVAGNLGVSVEEILRRCIDKLRKRFPGNYSDAAAEARADKGGLPALVS